MDDKMIADRSKTEVEKGVEALNRKDMDKASDHFWKALDYLEDIQDDRMRRDELGPLALYYVNLGLLDLAVMGAREAIALDKKLGDIRHQAEDIVTLGNANMQLGKLDEAVRNYREALQLCLENGDFDNAASASTNLAGIIANQNKMPEAITLLRNSLGYLQKKAHPDTEKITRLTLVQALGMQKESPEELIDVAEKLLNRFGHELAPDHIKVIAPYIDKAVQQYLQANSQIDPQAWKAAHFPRLYQ